MFPCLVCPAGQMGITFDDLTNETYNYFSPLPNVYAGFQWNNVYLTTAMPNDTGYLTALKSGLFVIFNNLANPMYISHFGTRFTLNSLVATAAHIDGLRADFDELLPTSGPRHYRAMLNTSVSTTVILNWTNLSRIEISSPQGIHSHIAIDNVCVTL